MMKPMMYQITVPVLMHNLKNLAAILKLAAKDAKARGIDPSVLLNSRLAPDMFALARQVQVACDHAKGCGARLAGIDVPSMPDNETTFAELDERIKKTLRFLRSLKPAQFEGSESRTIVMKIPIGKLEFNGLDYVNGWSMPNFYFHYSAVYNILRHNGVGVGKREFLGAVPGMQMSGKIARMMGPKPAAKAEKAPVGKSKKPAAKAGKKRA